MKTLEVSCKFELQEIEKNLSDLSITVEKDKCLNAGGKFEWVDSVFVKVNIFFVALKILELFGGFMMMYYLEMLSIKNY